MPPSSWDMAGKFNNLISKVVVILSAFLFSQFPAFENSYVQRLSGHVDELRYQVELMQENARQSGKTLDELITKFISNPDDDFQRQGTVMNRTKERLISLENALFNLDKASTLTRPFVFFLNIDPVIARSAFQKFRFSLPLTLEGLIWGVFGAFVGYFVFVLAARAIGWIGHMRREGYFSSKRESQ